MLNRKESENTSWKIILVKLQKYLLICTISLILFSILYKTSIFNHKIQVFISFMLLPILILIITNEEPNLGSLNKNIFTSILIYFFLFLWILSYFPTNKDFYSAFNMSDKNIFSVIKWNILVFLHVSTIDFFTKRIVQFKGVIVFGEKIGLLIQLIVWMVAHIREFYWLNDLMGNFGAFLFLFISGFLTGFVYMKT